MGPAARAWALSRLELRRLTRQRSLWIALVPAYLLLVLLGATSPGLNRSSGTALVADWAVFLNMLLGLVLAPAFAGVFDDQRGLSEVLRSTPTPAVVWLGARLVGTLGVLLPALGILTGVAVITAASTNAWGAVPGTLAVFALITVPGALAALGLAALLGTVLPTVFARLAALLGWFWAALFDTPTIPGPSLGGTVMSPAGDAVAYAVFGSTANARDPSLTFAALNVVTLVVMAGAATWLAGRAANRLPR